MKLYESLVFEIEGRIRREVYVNGSYIGIARYMDNGLWMLVENYELK